VNWKRVATRQVLGPAAEAKFDVNLRGPFFQIDVRRSCDDFTPGSVGKDRT